MECENSQFFSLNFSLRRVNCAGRVILDIKLCEKNPPVIATHFWIKTREKLAKIRIVEIMVKLSRGGGPGNAEIAPPVPNWKLNA